MGNVNGSGSPTKSGSGVVVEHEDEEIEEETAAHAQTQTQTETETGAMSMGVGAGAGMGMGMGMGESPPESPRATVQSPLKFAPQPPVAPIDELHIPNPTSPPPDEDMNYQQGIPTMITWSYAANHVAVQGSWDNWNSRKPLQKSGKDFTLMKVLPSGVYQYRFIVDGTPTYAPDIPSTLDDSGIYYNVLDLQDYVPEDTKSISGFDPPQSPDGSYNNTELNQEDFAKEPPLVPPHLNMTLLNVPSLCTEVPPPSLARPQHVVLNHLYMQKGKSGPSVVALGSTHRFKAKYVTVVLYKSL